MVILCVFFVDFLLVMEFSCLALLGHHWGYILLVLVDFLMLPLVVLLIKIVLPISPPSERSSEYFDGDQLIHPSCR